MVRNMSGSGLLFVTSSPQSVWVTAFSHGFFERFSSNSARAELVAMPCEKTDD